MGESPEPILIAKGENDIFLLPKMANRHGLIAGATGTGKTVTLRVLAEQFSEIGVPVFMADVKGDLAGIVRPGGGHLKVTERIDRLRLTDFQFEGYPVVFWDILKDLGHPVRTTISEMGPLLMGRLLNLNETQAGVLSLVFKIADESGYLLLDLKDLRSMVQFVGENADQFRVRYGNVSTASIGAIQRSLVALEEQGGGMFFGEPALGIDDLLQTDQTGRGVINILAAEKLIRSPKLYATFLLWILAELFEQLPEVGDPQKPKLVFFFDEAHLLFDDTPVALKAKIEQVVRLIRSKGVGIYFVTQNPLDLPDAVLGQLGNRIQHALRAFTPRDQKAVKAAADTFRTNPRFDAARVIMELGVGEALVSVLDEKGVPTVVDRALIMPPRSSLNLLRVEEREKIIRTSVLYGHYEKMIDRESAYEKLKTRAEEMAVKQKENSALKEKTVSPRKKQSADLMEAFTKSTVRAIGSQIGRQIIRGIFGSMLGGRKK
jgi:uncharacterized protein